MSAEEKGDRPGRCLAAIARLVARLALLAVATAWVVEAVWSETTWLTALITYAPPLVFVGVAAVASVLGWITRERQALVVGLLAVAVALGTVARPSIHRHQGLTRTMESVRVVTWNVHNHVDALPAIKARLEALQPDVVCLQEAYDRRFLEVLAGAEAARLSELVTLSRLKVVRAGPVPDLLRHRDLRVPLEMRVETRSGQLSVLNMHLFSYRPLPGSGLWSKSTRRHALRAIEFRNEELDLVDRWLDEEKGTKIVAGDFNTPPRGKLYRRVAGRLADAFATAGNGFGWTFPEQFPLWRIDYVWLGGGLKALDCRAVSCPPSDHCPVVADIEMPRRTNPPVNAK